MGDTPCKIIIIEGNLAYAVVESIAEKNHQINTYLLEAAIRASCEGVHHASLYSAIKGYGEPQEPTLQAIIELHKQITTTLFTTDKSELQEAIDMFAISLFTATRELYSFDEGNDFQPVSLPELNSWLK